MSVFPLPYYIQTTLVAIVVVRAVITFTFSFLFNQNVKCENEDLRHQLLSSTNHYQQLQHNSRQQQQHYNKKSSPSSSVEDTKTRSSLVMDLARGSGFQGKRETLKVHLILGAASDERQIGYVLLPPSNTVHFYRVQLAELDASIERLYWLYVSR